MPQTPSRVKGIKYGTMAQYNAICNSQAGADPDMLYFLTDKGLLYRGNSLVVPRNYTTYTPTIATGDVVHDNDQVVFCVETYGNGGEQQGSPLIFTVCTKEAVLAITSTLNAAIINHRSWNEGSGQDATTVYADGKASSTNFGHVKLSDVADPALDASSGTAATPAAIAAALVDLAGAMRFKGTIGRADRYSANLTYNQGDFCENGLFLYRCTEDIEDAEAFNPSHWAPVPRSVSALPTTKAIGDTYRVVAPNTYNGHRCEIGDMIICVSNLGQAEYVGPDPDPQWTVAQTNIEGAVYSKRDLIEGALVLGAGGREVSCLLNGASGNYLRMGANGRPDWKTHTALDHGITYGNCVGTSSIQTLLDQGFVWQAGAIVNCKVSANLSQGARLNVGSNYKAIYYNGVPITEGIVKANDVCTFVYDGTNFVLMAISRQLVQDVPTNLSQLANDIMGLAQCTTSSSTLAKEASLAGFTVANGAFVAVRFYRSVPASSTLSINSTTAMPIYHRAAAITEGVIQQGDTATFVIADGKYHLVSIDRGFDATPTSGSHNLVDSDAVYQFVEERTLYWEEMPAVNTVEQ